MRAFYFNKKEIMRNTSICLLLLTALITSCGDSSLTRTLPNVTGTTGEVLVVMNRYMWDGSPGQAVREQVSPMLIGLPQEEPAFTILPVNPEGFRDIYLAHRNVIQAVVDPGKPDPEVVYARNKWAETQLVISVTAPDTAALAQCIRDNGEAIRRSINDTEREADTLADQLGRQSEKCDEGRGDTMGGSAAGRLEARFQSRRNNDDLRGDALHNTVSDGICH